VARSILPPRWDLGGHELRQFPGLHRGCFDKLDAGLAQPVEQRPAFRAALVDQDQREVTLRRLGEGDQVVGKLGWQVAQLLDHGHRRT